MNSATVEAILRPLRKRGGWERPAIGAMSAAAACWLYASVKLVTEGHTLLGTTSYGVSWGLTVAGVIHVIGISHVGIAVSAAVRILRLDRYRSVARLAEVMTLIALVVAVLNIALDVGRPDRFVIDTLIHGRWHAPMVWSATVISLYFVASGVYLYLSLRRDLWVLSGEATPLQRIYGRLALGYRDTRADRDLHTRTLRWLGIALVPIMVSVHSVYGLFFGLLSARPGWYNPLQAPYFVLGAVVSGFSALIVAAALLRRLYRWQELIDDRTFRVLGAVLAFVVFLYLYFVASEHVTAQFTAAPGERAVSGMSLGGPYATVFWATILAGLVAPFLILFHQAMRTRPVSVPLVAVAAGAINVAMFLKRVLLVVPAQEFARLPLPMPVIAYRPTLVELVASLGTCAVGGLLFIGALKVIPLIELPLPLTERLAEIPTARAHACAAVIAGTLVVGFALIGWGVGTRADDFAPLKWILGLCLLAAVPLEVCLIRGEARPLALPDETMTLTGGRP